MPAEPLPRVKCADCHLPTPDAELRRGNGFCRACVDSYCSPTFVPDEADAWVSVRREAQAVASAG